MWKKVVLAWAVLAAGFAGYVATRPGTFRVERSLVIAAPAEKVFPLINDFRAWSAWSPWEKLDPAMKRTMSGPAQGVGAVYGWEGDKNVGAGRMEILESVPPSKVLIRLEFLKPFESSSTAEFTLAPEGAGTRVTWVMSGACNFVSKAMGVFCSMDKMVGGDFEKGLAALAMAVEKQAAV